MRLKTNIILREIDLTHPNLKHILSLSIDNSSNIKMQETLRIYKEQSYYLLGGFIEDELVAILGAELDILQAIIKHISVLPRYQRQNIGNNLINYFKNKFSLQTIIAGTDDDAIEFYIKLGFTCKVIKNKSGKEDITAY